MVYFDTLHEYSIVFQPGQAARYTTSRHISAVKQDVHKKENWQKMYYAMLELIQRLGYILKDL